MTTSVISRQRLEFAATGFLAEMRRQHISRFPDAECRVLNLSDYGPEDRATLMAALEKVIQLASHGSDQTFAAWLERKAQAQDPLAS